MFPLAVEDPTSVLVEHGATSIDAALKFNNNPEMVTIDVFFQTSLSAVFLRTTLVGAPVHLLLS
jgi:hypothetical protein